LRSVKVARVGQGHVTFDDVWLVAAERQAVLSRPLFRRRSQAAGAAPCIARMPSPIVRDDCKQNSLHQTVPRFR
jgi:hypothetical protein